METKLVVILHADVVGSTALVQIDERVAHERIQDAFLRLSESISNYRGSTHEVRGDALVAEFDRGSDAISAALDFQAANRRHNRGLVGEIRPELRVGIAMGEVIIADNTLTGAGVVLAQRLEQLAADGGVVVQGAVYEATPRRLPFDYEFLGEQTLKGFDELVRAYSVGLKAGESIPVPESARQFDSRRAPGSPPLELPSKPSIAILPFENLSADPEQEYFSDGIAEDVITALSRFHDLFVIARNSSFVYRGRSVDVREVGRELGVQYVVEGSVRRSGPRVRLSVQLIEAATGNHIWAERFDRSLEDVFAVQDEVTERVAAAVGRSVNVFEGTRAVERRPQELGGWELLARAEWHVNRTSQDSLSRARALCLEAIERFPDYPSGYSLLARVYCLQSLYGVAEGSVDDAARVARQAIALDPNDERAHIYLARVLMVQGRHDEALLEAEAALSINPNYAHGIGFAGCIEAISGRSSYGARWNI